MADISNLSNFLEDVADAIRTKKETTEKIPAANFDTEILSITTGMDTSDATATANDILYPKTAYANGQKITGAIETENAYLGDVSYSSNTAITGQFTKKQTTVVLPDGNRLCILNGNINVYNSSMQLLNSYSLESFGVPVYSGAHSNTNSVDVGSFYDTTNSLLVLLMGSDGRLASGSIATISMLYYCNGELGVINHIGQTDSYKTFSITSHYEMFAAKCCNTKRSFIVAARGYGVYMFNVNDDLTYNRSTITTSANLYRVFNADITLDDKWLVLNHDISWDNSQNVLISLQNNSIVKSEEILTDMIFVGNNHIIIKDDLYALNNDTNTVTLIKEGLTGLLNDSNGESAERNTYGYYKGVYNNGLLAISNDTSNVTLFALTNIITGDITNLQLFTVVTGKGVKVYKTTNGVGLVLGANSGQDCILETDIVTYTQANIYGSKLYNPYDADITSGDIFSDKIAYGKDGKLIGTMPNNGELNYEVSTSEQVIPEGYTSGGTIAASPQSQNDYKDCLSLTNNILYGHTPLNFIKSSRTQYIDTGVIPDENTIVEIELEKSSDSKILWERVLGVDNQFMVYIDAKLGTSDKNYKWFANMNTGGMTIHIVEYDKKTKLKLGNGNIYYNNQSSNTYSATPNTQNSIYLFYSNGGDVYSEYKLYSCKIYSGETLIKDFIPVLDKNNVACLYDKINSQYFYNQGTGQFLYE